MKPKYMCAAKYIFSFKLSLHVLFTKSWMLYERERESSCEVLKFLTLCNMFCIILTLTN